MVNDNIVDLYSTYISGKDVLVVRVNFSKVLDKETYLQQVETYMEAKFPDHIIMVIGNDR